MRVRVRYFAGVREQIGRGEEMVETLASTVGGLRDELLLHSPAHAAALGRGQAIRLALDQRVCDEATPLHEQAEVAFFPPVTGG